MADQEPRQHPRLLRYRRCTICGADSPASARYCANCGSELGESNAPSAFEVGRIAALDSVKSEIIKWLGVPFAIVTVLTGVLGYFGIANMISSEVHDQVQKQIETSEKQIENSFRSSFSATTSEIMKKFSEIANEQGSINALEKDEEKALAESKLQQSTLNTSIQNTNNTEKQLQQQIATLKVGPFLAKLRYDFSHLQDFAVSSFIDLDPSMKPDLQTNFPHAEYVKLVGDSNDGVDPVRLERDQASAQEDTTGITGINIHFALPFTERGKLIDKEITSLSHINKIQLVFYCDSKFRDKLESITKAIKAVYLYVLVNGRPLWRVEMSKSDLTVEESSAGDNATFAINMKLKYYGDSSSLLSAYEALFTDEKSQ